MTASRPAEVTRDLTRDETRDETHARTAACPSCHATPGEPCRHPNGTTAARSHRYRRRAARRLGDGQAASTTTGGQP